MRGFRIRFIGLAVAAFVITAFLSGCGGSDTTKGPTITATNSAGTIYTTQPLSITFSEAMDQASVEGAFSVAGSGAVSGAITWSGNTLIFTPASRWLTHHTYTITIATAAMSAAGLPIDAQYTQTFTPSLNMHDVNGDGIADFMLGSSQHDYSPTVLDAGQAYLFLGRTTWSDFNLSTTPADATFSMSQGGIFMGADAKVVGDMNGDGYADMAFSSAIDEGFVGIVFGSASPTGFTVDPAVPATIDNFSALAVGPDNSASLGVTIMPAGDVNNDGLADVIVVGKDITAQTTKYWLILGRTTAFPTPSTFPLITAVADAVYTVPGISVVDGAEGMPVAACDVNGDEYDDMIFGAPLFDATNTGKVLVVAGSTTPASVDLGAAAASETLTGANAGDKFGASVACGDVNGDGFGDIMAGAPQFSNATGRIYLVGGASAFKDHNFSTDTAMALFTGPAATTGFGTIGCIQGDVNKDGFPDMIVSAPLMTVGGTANRGSTWLFLGASAPTGVDLATGSANATFVGTNEGGAFGYCKAVGDANGDGIDDILLGEPGAGGGGIFRGQVFLIFGAFIPASLDLSTQSANATFTGAADNDLLSLALEFL